MVYRVVAAEETGNDGKNQMSEKRKRKGVRYYCNKVKANTKFKKSTSLLQEDGLSSAILLLACIVFSR